MFIWEKIMKKTLILITTIILAFSMVSCNIQEFVSGWGATSTTSGEATTSNTTSTTTIPKEEPTYVLLKDILPPKDQIGSVTFQIIRHRHDSTFSKYIDVGRYYELIAKENVAFVSNETNNFEIYDKILADAWFSMKTLDEYILFDMCNLNGEYLGYLILYPNSTVDYYNYKSGISYTNVEKIQLDVNEIIEIMNREGFKK